MKVWLLVVCAISALALAQDAAQPLASFAGTVKRINATTLTLARQDQEDLEISCTHKTHYFKGDKKIKREEVQRGDRVSVETKLDLYLRPEAVNVRVLPPEKP
ncbi:MAG TPA: hypothetical protein VMU80_20115 [Bryobacteraceae bacterium]|nr:hypothetical protein [Bryobacteraceae bacterium]